MRGFCFYFPFCNSYVLAMEGNDPLEGEEEKKEEQANFWATNNEIYKKKYSNPVLDFCFSDVNFTIYATLVVWGSWVEFCFVPFLFA